MFEEEIIDTRKNALDINPIALAECAEKYKDNEDVMTFIHSLEELCLDVSARRILRIPSTLNQKIVSNILTKVLVEVVNTTIH